MLGVGSCTATFSAVGPGAGPGIPEAPASRRRQGSHWMKESPRFSSCTLTVTGLIGGIPGAETAILQGAA